MRIAFLSLLVVALSAGCSSNGGAIPVGALPAEEAPPQELVSQIEAQLARYECIGSLDRWARFYQWKTFPNDYRGDLPRSTEDRFSEVSFVLKEAGKFGWEAGSFVEPLPSPLPRDAIVMTSDHRQYLLAIGTYNVEENVLHLRHCGPNMGSQEAIDSDRN